MSANPSKGDAARQLIAELNANTNLRGSAAVAVVTPPIAPPVKPPVTPPTEDNSPGGTRVFEGETAGQILRAANNGSRYMAVIRREWDPARSCFVEDRAWVSGIKGSDGGRVAVQIGPVRQVCVRGNALSSAQVNEAEVRLQSTRNELYKALKAKQELELYLKISDPARVAWAKGEIQKVDTWIKKYEQDIAKLQAAVATSAPQ